MEESNKKQEHRIKDTFLKLKRGKRQEGGGSIGGSEVCQKFLCVAGHRFLTASELLHIWCFTQAHSQSHTRASNPQRDLNPLRIHWVTVCSHVSLESPAQTKTKTVNAGGFWGVVLLLLLFHSIPQNGKETERAFFYF